MPPVITASEAERRLIRRSQYVSCAEAFIDCRRPGSMPKENYAMIGPGVTQNATQVVNLKELHGFNIGAAAMPHGITNNLHIHFTSEVFICARGEWLLRWGNGGKDGEIVMRAGDIACMPTWIFRGFTNIGPDDGWLFTCLGGDDTGGIIWDPAILREAGAHGLWLTAENELIETAPGAGEPSGALAGPPAGLALMPELQAADIAALKKYSVAEMAARILPRAARDFAPATLDGVIEQFGAEWAPVIGYGLTQRRQHRPAVADPQGFSIEWLRLAPGKRSPPFCVTEKMVVILIEGDGLEVAFNDAAAPVRVTMNAWDTLSVPGGVKRAFANIGVQTIEAIVILPGDQRKTPKVDASVLAAARQQDWALDANGYLARASMMPKTALAAGERIAI